MAVFYKAVKIKTPLSKNGKTEMYYPRVANRRKENLRDIAERISDMSSFNRSDVIASFRGIYSINSSVAER